MSQLDKLMRLEDIEKWLSAVDEPTKSVHLYPKCTGEKGGDAIGVYIIAKQLADTMRENERLREALQYIANGHPDGNPIFLINEAKEALASCKHRVGEKDNE